MQDTLEVLVCGKIAHKILVLNPTVSEFEHQNAELDEQKTPETTTTHNKPTTPVKKKWIQPKKIALHKKKVKEYQIAIHYHHTTISTKHCNKKKMM